jgi:hypothetical protein
MKTIQIALSFSIVSVVFFGCRKDGPRVFEDNFVETGSSYCTNGIQDSNEEGIDCGGPCGMCNALTLPCTIVPNELYVDGELRTYSYSDVYSDEITIAYSGGFSLNLRFVSNSVIPGIIYNCTGSAPSGGYVRVSADNGSEFWYYSGTSNQLFLEGSESNLSVTFCELELTSNMTGIEHSISGNKSQLN